MPAASRLAFIAVLLLGSGVIACGGDDGDDDADEPTRTRTATASRVTRTPTPGADEKTPGPEESPAAVTSGATAPPTAALGTPAAEPPDTPAYLSQFLGRTDLGEVGCAYNPSTRLTDCGGRGLYSVTPPLGGQDISCFITIVGNNPEYIRCTSAEPAETKWYDVQ